MWPEVTELLTDCTLSRASSEEATAEKDDSLVLAAKAGNSEALGKLLAANKHKSRQLARRITRSDSDADEVVQDAFTQVCLHLDSFNGASRFSTWLTRIVINQALMTLRKRRPQVESFDESVAAERRKLTEIRDSRPTPEEDCSQRERQKLLSVAVERLNPSLRSVIHLQLAGFSPLETSRILDLTLSTVKSRLFHARMKLRQALGTGRQTRKSQGLAVRSDLKRANQVRWMTPLAAGGL